MLVYVSQRIFVKILGEVQVLKEKTGASSALLTLVPAESRGADQPDTCRMSIM